MPRRSNAEAARTRAAIIERAVETASIEGLEGVTIGRLADDLGLSKAGVIGHFGSKADLQRAALQKAQAIFTAEVWDPARTKPGGLERLLAICDNWIAHLAHCPFPGGCFMTTVSVEWDARSGDLHDEIREGWNLWHDTLRFEARRAVERGELPAGTDPGQVAFELLAIAMGLNQSIQLLGDRRAPARARQAFRRALRQA
jgi:AcrR family transcriptional regulator